MLFESRANEAGTRKGVHESPPTRFESRGAAWAQPSICTHMGVASSPELDRGARMLPWKLAKGNLAFAAL